MSLTPKLEETSMGSTTLPRDRLAVRIGLSSLLTLVIATAIGLSSGFGPATAQDVDRKAKSADKKTQPPKVKLGLILNDPKRCRATRS